MIDTLGEKLDVFVIGGAMMDTFIFPEEGVLQSENGKDLIAFTYGSKIPISRVHSDIGGGGANTAVGLARHGLKTSLHTKLGKDEYADIIRKRLKEEQVSTTHIKMGTIQTGMSIILQGLGRDRTIFTYRGTNSEMSSSDIPSDIYKHTRYILVNALYDSTSNMIMDIVQKTRESGVKVALSLGRSEIYFQGNHLVEIMPAIDLLIVNEEESQALYHVLTNNFHKEFEECDACHKTTNEILQFLHDSGVATVGVTLGASGVKFIDEHNTLYAYPSKKAEAVNTTGLGDAFFAGFLAYTVMGKSIEEAALHGIDNAVSVMGYLGAQIGLLRS